VLVRGYTTRRALRFEAIPAPHLNTARAKLRNQMTEPMKFNSARLIVIALSSITMLWLLWRFPIQTCIVSIVLLGFLLHCVQFARVVDVAFGPD